MTDNYSKTDRRDFLKAAGFGLAGAAISSCGRAPVEKAIPYLVKPETVTPGVALLYASTCHGCCAGCGLLVKNRDGRPIKVEGNPDHPLSGGGTCAVGQASILGLYDGKRLARPLLSGKPAAWEDVDRDIGGKLEAIRRQGGAVRLLTGTMNGPTARWVFERFLGSFADGRRVSYDALSASAMLDAHERTLGVRLLPRVHLERARLVVAFEADFLGTWLSPVEYTGAYRRARNVDGPPHECLRHVQIESGMSVTGAKADTRFAVPPEGVGAILAAIAARVARQAGVVFDAPAGPAFVDERTLDELADALWSNRERSLVLCGSQQVDVQVVACFVNHLLGSYGTTISVEEPSLQREGDDRAIAALLDDCEAGRVAALLVAGVNPAYDLPAELRAAERLARVPLVISFATHLDETARLAHAVCPVPHYLESWDDAEPVAGLLAVSQSVIEPIHRTRALMESLTAWLGDPVPARELMRRCWQTTLLQRLPAAVPFDDVWDRAVHDGFVRVGTSKPGMRPFSVAAVAPLAAAARRTAGMLSLVLYPKVTMLDGSHAHNPWLQELPDPISKVTWDNYACLAPAAAARMGLVTGDLVRIEADGAAAGATPLVLPTLVQPGQHPDVVAIALGYGRLGTDRFAAAGPRWIEARSGVGPNGLVGVNAAPLLMMRTGTIHRTGRPVRVHKTGGTRPLACVQTHHSLSVPEHLAPAGAGPRLIVQEATLQDAHTSDHGGGATHGEERHANLWPADHPFRGHHWGLAIDLAACTGCGACVIACQAENNIPVVGRDEVLRQREMHWLRIDRYYADRADGGVDVVHQPMLCQHCEHAPCETVCPVLATVHSEEGLNEQVYNRCVGTRYCANNCPYKVRRFNWFNYPRDDRLQNLVLNPDVTVRSRGVMEKCSLCIQRIEGARIAARQQGRAIADGDIQTACGQACPAGAIVFGDLNDPASRVSRLRASARHFRVLEELGVKPAVGYLKVIRNRT